MFASTRRPIATNLAHKIGEPRLDSGVVIDDEDKRPPFDALTPLLPEEICWILDRSFAYEVNWDRLLFINVLAQNLYSTIPDGMACWQHPFTNRVYSSFHPSPRRL
jgi:hypothetical protein